MTRSRGRSVLKRGQLLRRTVFPAVVAVLTALPVMATAGEPTAGQRRAERLFTLKVLPVLKTKCFACHGDKPKDVKGKFDVRSRGALLKGGESGDPALVPGKPAKSPLYRAVRWQGLEMPPKKNDRLNATQIEWIRRWISAGAPWPDEQTQARYRKEHAKTATKDGVIVRTSGGLSADWTQRRYQPTDLWAFVPLKRVAVPKTRGSSHPIDAFLQRKLDSAQLKPAPVADRLTLIRRATWDLTGLPPTPGEIRAFLNDKSPDAWKKLIDRLLASPHYGERWGQHWLDVVRYADTSGYSNDWERSNAWRYRDYVIRSLNADKPYNRFILEQIAGDELDPDDRELRVAVGYLRMGPWEHTGMVQDKVSRQLWLDDVVNSVGQTFLSTALRCAKCHDHKFDPLPTRDYYRFQAAFAATQLAERPAPFLKSENRRGFSEGRKRLQKLLKWAQDDVAKITAKEEQAGRVWARKKGIPFVPRTFRNKDVPEDKKPPRHIGLNYFDLGFFKVRRQAARIWKRRLERYEPLAQGVYNGGDWYPQSVRLRLPQKPRDKKLAGRVPQTFLLSGGSVFSRRDELKPGALSAVPASLTPGARSLLAAEIPTTMGGRRLALAKWIADARNPLTTRSIVNRVWQYHFGRGIAANSNNFGQTGKKPTHPELLDWLAGDFVKNGWSLKKLHRLIMTSQAYRRSSRPGDAGTLSRKDPNNDLLSHFRPRRLSAEELRDGMLSVAGVLNREIGGLPIRPEINLEVALQPRMLQGSLAPAYQPSRTPAERNRRSIYVHRSRGLANPLLEVFNKPGSSESCERRDSSAVTPQVFTLMNGTAATDLSIAMALRLEKSRKPLDARIAHAYALAFGRKPTAKEQTLLTTHFRKMVTYHRVHKPKTSKPPPQVTRSNVEEMSGQAFKYVERLDVYENYVPNKKPWDVSAETRALADVCLLLFNANEFVYVY